MVVFEMLEFCNIGSALKLNDLSVHLQVVMTFSNPSGDTRQVLLPRRSVLLMTGASRYLWSHGIVPRKTDVINSVCGLTLAYRQTRVSFTFRRLRRAACDCGKKFVWLFVICRNIMFKPIII